MAAETLQFALLAKVHFSTSAPALAGVWSGGRREEAEADMEPVEGE